MTDVSPAFVLSLYTYTIRSFTWNFIVNTRERLTENYATRILGLLRSRHNHF